MKQHVKVMIAVVVIFAAGVVAGHLVSPAEAGNKGDWQCYAADRMPDTVDAADYKWAGKIARGLNQSAPHAKSGTVLFMNFKDLICVK